MVGLCTVIAERPLRRVSVGVKGTDDIKKAPGPLGTRLKCTSKRRYFFIHFLLLYPTAIRKHYGY